MGVLQLAFKRRRLLEGEKESAAKLVMGLGLWLAEEAEAAKLRAVGRAKTEVRVG